MTGLLTTARKALVALVGAVAAVVAAGILSGTAAQVAGAVLAVATALGVYHVANVPAPPKAG